MRGCRVKPSKDFIRFEKEEIEQSIPDRFEKQVAKYADCLAVKGRNYELTYRELNESANRLAQAILRQRGEGEEAIALLFEHDAPVIVAIMAVLKAGKFYVPLDPSYPQSRIAYMLEDSQAGLILTNNSNLALARELSGDAVELINVDDLDSSLSTENPGLSIPPETLAHIIYTSGSTGQPKGVTQNHRGMLHSTMVYTNELCVCTADRLALLMSCSFSASLSNMFSSLLNGAAIFPFDLKADSLRSLAHWLIHSRITIFTMVPVVFRHFVGTLAEVETFSDLRIINLGADRLYRTDVELYKKRFSPSCLLSTGLGTSEAKSISMWFMDKETKISGSIVPVGYASLDDTDVLLLDDNGKEVDFNQIGEIAVRSRYISPGYWRMPDLTKAKFLPDPEGTDKRVYCTGDLGIMSPDRFLTHVGRKDFQVKIRGHRVEIGEIEAALLALDTVAETFVISQENDSGDHSLVAYIVSATQQLPRAGGLRRAVSETLPDYMVPSAYVILDALPLTPTGKIDRLGLPAPDAARPALEEPFAAPRNDVERKLAQIWSEVLNLDQVGINDSFFDLGGNSLTATQIVSRMNNALKVEITLKSFFNSLTVANVATAITQKRAEKEGIEDIKKLPAND